MELTWLGHAAFRVRTGNTTVIMDPFGPGLGLSIPPAQTQADVVTLSSDAAHHAAVSIVTGDKPAVVFSDPGEYEAAGIQLRGIRTTRGDGAGDDDDDAEDSCDNGVFCDGVERCVDSVCETGDVPCAPSPFSCVVVEWVEEAGSCDVQVSHNVCDPGGDASEPTY